MTRTSKYFVTVISTVLLAMGLVHAHPHLRLAYQLDPMLDPSRQLTGFHISWQMDAQNTLLVRENIDLIKNGLLDPDELQAFADSNSPLMKPYNYFLTIEDGKSATPLPFEVRNFSARDGGRGFEGGIYFEFDVLLSQPISHNQALLQMQDPTWYIGFMPRMGKVLAAESECNSNFTREKRQTPTQGEQEVQRIVVQCLSGSVARPDVQISPTHGSVNGVNS